MKFTFIPLIQQVTVDFGAPIRHDQDLFDRYFPGGLPLLNDDGGWIGVLCTLDQWDAYLKQVILALQQARPSSRTLASIGELLDTQAEFNEFRQNVMLSPLYDPRRNCGAVA